MGHHPWGRFGNQWSPKNDGLQFSGNIQNRKKTWCFLTLLWLKHLLHHHEPNDLSLAWWYPVISRFKKTIVSIDSSTINHNYGTYKPTMPSTRHHRHHRHHRNRETHQGAATKEQEHDLQMLQRSLARITHICPFYDGYGDFWFHVSLYTELDLYQFFLYL